MNFDEEFYNAFNNFLPRKAMDLKNNLMNNPFFERNPMRTNLKETEDMFELSIEVPGVKKENITIKDENEGIISVVIDIDEKNDEKEGKMALSERFTGHMERKYLLNKDIDTDNIKAKLTDGILIINVPKKNPEIKEKRKIEIE